MIDTATSLMDLAMNGNNGVDTLRQWAIDTLEESLDDRKAIQELTFKANQVIDLGGFRGNISDAWKRAGYTTADIPGMYP